VVKRYSPFAPDEVHADMRVDAVLTWRDVQQQPLVAEAHRECNQCAELLPARAVQRLAKLRFTLQEVSDLFVLPAGVRAVRMYVENDPHALFVVLEGDVLPEVPDGAEVPYAPLGPDGF